MNVTKTNLFLILSINLFILLSSQIISGQEYSKNTIAETPKAKLVDEYQWIGSDDASARIDLLRQEVSQKPNSKGFIIVYCGKSCQYGEVEAHIRGIKLSLQLKGVNKNQFHVFPGGFQEKTTTEFWVVPENACPPIPNSTIDIKDVKFKGNFKRRVVPYECC